MNGLRWKQWLALVLIFVVGALTGAALTMGLKSEWMHPPSVRQMQHHWLEHLTTRLDLTPDQQAKVQVILEKSGEEIRGLHRDEVNRISTIFQATDAQIKPLLTSDQQAKFAAMQMERQKDFSRHLRHGEGPPSDGPPPR